jgi:hypothetical protein
MPHYPAYTTTVVGAHSVPRWYEALDHLVALGQLAEGDLTDAQLRASQAAILEQEIAGIDIITGGEMHRRRHNRHAPPNAMLNYFWPKFRPSKARPSLSRSLNMIRTFFIPRRSAVDRSPITSTSVWSMSSSPSPPSPESRSR